jgi:predicted nucleotide-binding protein
MGSGRSTVLKTYQSPGIYRANDNDAARGRDMADSFFESGDGRLLTDGKLKNAIERLQRRMSELEALEPPSLDLYSPKVDALQASVDTSLAHIYGYNSVAYKRFHRTIDWACDIPSFGEPRELAQYRDDVAKGKAEVLAMLGQAVETLKEELTEHDMSDVSGSPATDTASALARPNGTKVVIGHGRSPHWRELKDFIRDRLHLPVEEFNSIATAGGSTTVRLEEMLDNAMFAFLVMTAEDEQPDGKFRARENVVHEVGLFQGRLGIKRAIVLLEDGCVEFSNIAGLGQIRFPKGAISAKFEDIRQVLEREGIKAY